MPDHGSWKYLAARHPSAAIAGYVRGSGMRAYALGGALAIAIVAGLVLLRIAPTGWGLLQQPSPLRLSPLTYSGHQFLVQIAAGLCLVLLAIASIRHPSFLRTFLIAACAIQVARRILFDFAAASYFAQSVRLAPSGVIASFVSIWAILAQPLYLASFIVASLARTKLISVDDRSLARTLAVVLVAIAAQVTIFQAASVRFSASWLSGNTALSTLDELCRHGGTTFVILGLLACAVGMLVRPSRARLFLRLAVTTCAIGGIAQAWQIWLVQYDLAGFLVAIVVSWSLEPLLLTVPLLVISCGIRHAERDRGRLCDRCGYIIMGTGATCPECGTAVPPRCDAPPEA